ncbi:MAG: type VI secretion system ATPase TssH, partial [Anaerolineales bacterium]|nr:type VI secretion system ATPase TssH [Anaerolineales bacterium]
MNLNKFTQKAQEAVLEAQALAEERHHSQIEPIHLLAVLLNQQEGVVPQLVNRIGVNLGLLKEGVERQLGGMARAIGSTTDVRISRELNNVIRSAEREAEKMKDDYVSTEHLFLALVDAVGQVSSLRLLGEQGINRDNVLHALNDVRGGQRVSSQNPEATYDSLRKYGRDLTQMARVGKLDPVIGRDEEVRRVIQVLSRRTKNNPV